MSNTRTKDDDVADQNTAREEEVLEKRREIGRLQREMVLTTVPQEPGDPGYEPPYISPELDLEGGTVYRVGDDVYETPEDAQEAVAPPEAEPRDRDDDE